MLLDLYKKCHAYPSLTTERRMRDIVMLQALPSKVYIVLYFFISGLLADVGKDTAVYVEHMTVYEVAGI